MLVPVPLTNENKVSCTQFVIKIYAYTYYIDISFLNFLNITIAEKDYELLLCILYRKCGIIEVWMLQNLQMNVAKLLRCIDCILLWKTIR